MASKKPIQAQINELKASLFKMTTLVEEGLHHAIQSMVERDTALARQVIPDDEKINDLENDVNHLCMKLLDSKQASGANLRFITTAMRIATDLERVGDYSVNIARKAMALNEEPQLKPYVDMPKMAQIAQSMVRDVIKAFINGDAKLARSILERDDFVDSLDDQIFRELITYRISDAAAVSRAAHLVIVSRCLERIADHATNIAEEIIFMVEGEVVRHQRKRREEWTEAIKPMP